MKTIAQQDFRISSNIESSNIEYSILLLGSHANKNGVVGKGFPRLLLQPYATDEAPSS